MGLLSINGKIYHLKINSEQFNLMYHKNELTSCVGCYDFLSFVFSVRRLFDLSFAP